MRNSGEDGKIRGGLTIRKSILGEGERECVGMTDEEIKQEYLRETGSADHEELL